MHFRMSSARQLAAGALTAGLVASAAIALAPTASAAPGDVGVGRYNPIAPTRVLDTRTNNSPFGPQEVRAVDLTAAIGGSASAAVINFTVDQPTASGYLSVAPFGTSLAGLQGASVMNLGAGQTRANSVTVAVNAGKVSVYNNVGLSNVIIDVVGYYSAVASTTGTDYYPFSTPSRLFDTRSPDTATTTTAVQTLTSSGSTATLPVTVDYGSPEVNGAIKALALNLTVTNTAGPGFLIAWDGSGNFPTASAINWVGGQTIANTSIVPVRCTDASCSSVTFSIRNAVSPTTDVIADVVGYYSTAAKGGLVYDPKNPTRITDTRTGSPFGRLGPAASGTTVVRLSGVANEAQAVNLNVTAINPSSVSFVAVYPQPNPDGTPPLVSTLNVTPTVDAPNGAQVRVTQDGTITSYNNAGSLDLALDLEGQFLPDPEFG